MERKNKWIIGGLISLILAGGTILERQKNLVKRFQYLSNTPKIVKTGEVEYNKGNLVSYDFVRCSAVTMDYGDSALMAHAIPLYDSKLLKLAEGKSITVGGVVDSLIDKSKELGLNPEEAGAYVNAGDEKSLKIITEKLKGKNIPIIEAKIRYEKGHKPNSGDHRTILYSPSKNKFKVFKESRFPDYRETIEDSDWEGI